MISKCGTVVQIMIYKLFSCVVNSCFDGGEASNIIIIATYLLIVYLVYFGRYIYVNLVSTGNGYNKINLAPKLNIKILSDVSL